MAFLKPSKYWILAKRAYVQEYLYINLFKRFLRTLTMFKHTPGG